MQRRGQVQLFTILFHLPQQLNNLREQSGNEASRHREIFESTTQRLRNEELQKATIEERFEKASHELNHLRSEHVAVSESCSGHSHRIFIFIAFCSSPSIWFDWRGRWR